MRSPGNKTDIAKLDFYWEDGLTSALDSSADTAIQEGGTRPLETYLDFLAEIKPHEQELRDVTVFRKPFTLSRKN
jgi:hypothetical protein